VPLEGRPEPGQGDRQLLRHAPSDRPEDPRITQAAGVERVRNLLPIDGHGPSSELDFELDSNQVVARPTEREAPDLDPEQSLRLLR
jgi:hypothetical protein